MLKQTSSFCVNLTLFSSFLIERGQKDSLNLHSVLISSGMFAQTGESIELLRKIIKFQSDNKGIYFNADTGPSIMISSLDKNLILECKSYVNEDFLEGGMKYDDHVKKMNDFKKESEAYFNSISRE